MNKPEEFEKVEFSVSFRGYNSDQVDAYIDKVVKGYTEVYDKCLEYEKILLTRENEINSLKAELSQNSAKTEKADIVSPKSAEDCSVYKRKLEALHESIREFKRNAYITLQKQIKELQSFDANAENYSDTKVKTASEQLEDAVKVEEAPAQAEKKTVTSETEKVVEVKKDDAPVKESLNPEIADLVNDINISTDSVDASDINIDDLINDLYSEQVDSKNDVKQDSFDDILNGTVESKPDDIGNFNSMFITESDGD